MRSNRLIRWGAKKQRESEVRLFSCCRSLWKIERVFVLIETGQISFRVIREKKRRTSLELLFWFRWTSWTPSLGGRADRRQRPPSLVWNHRYFYSPFRTVANSPSWSALSFDDETAADQSNTSDNSSTLLQGTSFLVRWFNASTINQFCHSWVPAATTTCRDQRDTLSESLLIIPTDNESSLVWLKRFAREQWRSLPPRWQRTIAKSIKNLLRCQTEFVGSAQEEPRKHRRHYRTNFLFG